MTDLLNHYGEPIRIFLEDVRVTEICVNRFDEVWVEREGFLERTPARWRDEKDLDSYISVLAHRLSQEINEGNPILDARLPDGTRVNAVLPPVAVNGRCLSIRPYPKIQFDMGELVERGTLEPRAVDILESLVTLHANLIVSGGTGSGKTTFLRCLGQFIDPCERVITIEDTAEKLVDLPHSLSFEAAKRDPGVGGETITMERLIENALRQRPDRILVGEVRSPGAAIALVDAINTGHSGCISTTHANNARDALVRLENLYAKGALNFTTELVRRLIRSNINLVVHIARAIEGERRLRRVREIVAVEPDGALVHLCRFDGREKAYTYDEDTVLALQARLR